MKKTKSMLALVLLVMILVMVVLGNIPSYATTYKNDTYTIEIPSSYTVEKTENRLEAEKNNDVAMIIEVSDYNEFSGISMTAEFLSYMVTYLQNYYGSDIYVISQKLIEKNGCPGMQVQFQLKNTGRYYYSELLYLQTDHYLYSFTFVAVEKSYLDSTEKNNIINSFKTTDTVNKSNGIPFIDVSDSMWYYNSVKYCYQNEIIAGTSDNTFEPNTNISRAMLVTILWRMAGTPSSKVENNFPDVKEGLWYTNAIKWATGEKIVSGYDNGKFGPNDSITREQLAVMLRNYANYKKKNTNSNTNLNQYQDATKVSSWAKSAMQWAVGKKIISGKNNGTSLDPKGTATRAEAAGMINNYLVNVK